MKYESIRRLHRRLLDRRASKLHVGNERHEKRIKRLK